MVPLMQIYNDRRLFFGGGPGIVPNDSFGSVASSSQNADRRSSRSRGMLYMRLSQLSHPLTNIGISLGNSSKFNDLVNGSNASGIYSSYASDFIDGVMY